MTDTDPEITDETVEPVAEKPSRFRRGRGDTLTGAVMKALADAVPRAAEPRWTGPVRFLDKASGGIAVTDLGVGVAKETEDGIEDRFLEAGLITSVKRGRRGTSVYLADGE